MYVYKINACTNYVTVTHVVLEYLHVYLVTGTVSEEVFTHTFTYVHAYKSTMHAYTPTH